MTARNPGGVRRYANGASREPPYDAVLHLEEVRALDGALYHLRALQAALPTAATRRDARTAKHAIERLFVADRTRTR